MINNKLEKTKMKSLCKLGVKKFSGTRQVEQPHKLIGANTVN